MLRASVPTTEDIEEAWRVIARHADACPVCASPVLALALGPESPRPAEAAAYELMCDTGRPLLAAWIEAKAGYLDARMPLRVQQFITEDQLWDDGVAFAARSGAIMSMPGPAFAAWLGLPDPSRHAQLRALERSRHSAPAHSGRPTDPSQADRRPQPDQPQPGRRSTPSQTDRRTGAKRADSTDRAGPHHPSLPVEDDW